VLWKDLRPETPREPAARAQHPPGRAGKRRRCPSPPPAAAVPPFGRMPCARRR